MDSLKRPDLPTLIAATDSNGFVLQSNDIVIYESTVYPGATEEERAGSGAGNRGDKAHRLTAIPNVTFGSNPAVAEMIDDLIASIIAASTCKAKSVRVAEAAKVIENTQRDLDIALIDDLAIIFNPLGIDAEAALKTVGTKWKFLPFRPDLAGARCIDWPPTT